MIKGEVMTSARKENRDPVLRHPMVEQLSQLWRNKTAIAGLVVIAVFFLTAIFAPLLVTGCKWGTSYPKRSGVVGYYRWFP